MPPDTVVYAIGDIHGRHDLLAILHEKIADDARRRDASRRVLVYLGDYISRGLDSRRVVDMVRDWRPSGFEIVPLKGNHEDIMLDFLAGGLDRGNYWFDYDGMDALASYGVAIADRGLRTPDALEALRLDFAARLPSDHLDFFNRLKAHHDEGGYRFVHAGVRPGVPLHAQSDHDHMWIRQPFLDSTADHGATVVHGHSISAEPTLRKNRIGIDTGAYFSGVLTAVALDGAAVALLQARGPRGIA